LKNFKLLFLILAALGVIVFSLAGGALGSAFGLGFLSAPIPHIQLAAENISPNPLIGSFNITNTMIGTWIAIIILIIFSIVSTRKTTLIPSRIQGFVEVSLEFFINLTTSIAGKQHARRFFPLIMTIFLFVITANWIGILPGFNTIGWVEPAHHVAEHAHHLDKDLAEVKLQVFDEVGPVNILMPGSGNDVITAEEWEHCHPDDHKKAGHSDSHAEKSSHISPTNCPEETQHAGVLVPFFRSANTEINTTLAIAIVAMVMVHFWGFSTLGWGHAGKFINFKDGPTGFFVGILEAISELARLISFTFRLFGNVFAGEVLLIAMAFLVPLVGLVPFLGIELFVGAIQAFIFSILTLVFAAMATISHDTHSDH
jgi:F-type H+-transporting ATPase subunit a